MRLNKFLAHCGAGSRRESDQFIFDGEVRVNGKIQTNPATQVDPEVDSVKLRSRLLKLETTVYFAFYKPKNVLTTMKKDPKMPGRRIIPEFLKIPFKVFYLGRLDYDAEGLILLTNDGDLGQKTLHPKYEVEKVYDVCIDKQLEEKAEKKLRKGIYFDRHKAIMKDIKTLRHSPEGFLYRITLTQGMKRQIKEMFLKVGYRVKSIKRIHFANISLGNLKPGEARQLTRKEKDELIKLYKK